MRHFAAVTIFTSLLSGSITDMSAQADVIFADDFSAGSTPIDDHRVWDGSNHQASRIDMGWRATTAYASHIASAWDITGGRLENPTANTTSYVESETPAWIWLTNPLLGPTSDQLINVSFDYSTNGGDTLTAHFWAVQAGGTPTTGNQFITNNQGWINGNSGQNVDLSNGGYDTFNLVDGDTTPDNADHITGHLSGTGTFNWSVDVSTLGIAGVSDVGDIDTFFFAIAANETGGATSWVDNLSVTSSAVPEPSCLGLLGLGLGVSAFRRWKRLSY